MSATVTGNVRDTLQGRPERKWIGFDLNPAYEKLQNERTAQRTLSLTKVSP